MADEIAGIAVTTVIVRMCLGFVKITMMVHAVVVITAVIHAALLMLRHLADSDNWE